MRQPVLIFKLCFVFSKISNFLLVNLIITKNHIKKTKKKAIEYQINKFYFTP